MPLPPNKKSAYSLVEILMVMGILGFLMVGVLGIFIQSHNGMFVSVEKTKINRDMRMFTGDMANVARSSNHFFIYESFDAVDRNDVLDRKTRTQTGDFLVLVSQEPYPNPDDDFHITRIVGYYRNAATGALGPVMKFEIDYTPANYKKASTNQIETLLPAAGTKGTHEKIVEMSEGLANGSLFMNYEDRSIMIKGQIYHGNEYKRLTDTYNLTVTPRG